jgi:hypothetical protein
VQLVQLCYRLLLCNSSSITGSWVRILADHFWYVFLNLTGSHKGSQAFSKSKALCDTIKRYQKHPKGLYSRNHFRKTSDLRRSSLCWRWLWASQWHASWLATKAYIRRTSCFRFNQNSDSPVAFREVVNFGSYTKTGGLICSLNAGALNPLGGSILAFELHKTAPSFFASVISWCLPLGEVQGFSPQARLQASPSTCTTCTKWIHWWSGEASSKIIYCVIECVI